MRAIYSLLLVLVRPFVHLRLKWRARQSAAYGERTAERFGHVPAGIPCGALWFHTVSAGETIAAAPLINKLVADLAEQNIPVLVTTMTPTGSAEVTRLLGDSVAHCYAPYDFSDSVRRFLDATRPRALVLMETEIWPNMITLSARRDIPIALINARLSERSARGYRKVRPLLNPVLGDLSWIACQYPADAQRFRELGASGTQVEVVGNLKFDVVDVPVVAEQAEQLRLIQTKAGLAKRPVWIAGSTHKGEDPIVLDAHRQVLEQEPDACLILVPRHPERFTEVYELAATQFSTARLSDWLKNGASLPISPTEKVGAEKPEVLIADVMGLLRSLYGLAQVAFVGGSLVDIGGHNPIEAAVAKLPVLMGAGRHNFLTVCEKFAEAGCLHRVTDAQQISAQVLALLSDDIERKQQGERAAALVAEHSGATERLRRQLARIVAQTAPH